MILHFSINRVPLSLWPTSEEKKLASGLFASLVVLMDVKPKGPQSDWTSAASGVTSGPVSAGSGTPAIKV